MRIRISYQAYLIEFSLREVNLDDILVIIIINSIESCMNTYIHKTQQRLRVRSDFIRQHPEQVTDLIEQLAQIDAITSIKHKRYAGSVAINFQKNDLDCESLLEILESHQWTESDIKPSFVEKAVVTGTKTLTKGLATIALKRLVGTSMSRIIMSL